MSAMVSRAQQQPMYTQYMFNGLVLNPAYAGAQETFSATALARKQWVGMDGAPQTLTFSAHSPLDNLRTGSRKRPGSPVSVGVTLFCDRIAVTGQTGLIGTYAYKIAIGRLSSLSLGLQGGFSHYRIAYSELSLDDPAFALGDIVSWQPEFGAGVYYRGERLYAGLSAPQMLRPLIEVDNKTTSISPHFFLTTGYVFDISRSVKLKPNLLLKHSDKIYQLDLNCNVFLNEILNLGISWRSAESLSSLVQVQFNSHLGLGYAYDFGYGSEISRISSGSHEFMINYTVPRKNIRTINPRFF